MRKKSPASIQKWVDSIPHITTNNLFQSAAEADTAAACSCTTEIETNEAATAVVGAITKPATTIDIKNNIYIRIESDNSDINIAKELNDIVLNANNQDCIKTTNQLLDDFGDELYGDVSNVDGDIDVSNEIVIIDDEEINDINGVRKLNESKRFDILNKENNTIPLNCEIIINKTKYLKSDYLTRSKLKINEFYDKFNLNRERYNILKSKKMDIKNILKRDDKENFNNENGKQTNDNNEINLICDNMKNINFNENLNKINNNNTNSNTETDSKNDISQLYNSNRVMLNDIPKTNNQFEFSFDETFSNKDGNISDYSHDDELHLSDYQNDNTNFLNINMNTTAGSAKKSTPRLGIGDIGRSASENPSTSKKYCLNDIGRSFSEAEVLANDDDQYHDDDDDNLSVGVLGDSNIYLNEFNNSYPNSSSLNTSSSLNYSNSNLLRAKSVPVSPIPNNLFKSSSNNKKFISRDSSMQSTDSMIRRNPLLRDNSLQSDSSHCSSVESLLEARKPDPEAILVNLGLGPEQSDSVLSRLPKR